MDYLKFKFDKPWIRQAELLELTSMSASCLKRYMSEQLRSGKPLSEMGYVKFEGFREACWIPGMFCNWLMTNKIEPEKQYDYELAEEKRNRMNIVNLQKHQQQYKEVNTNDTNI
mgnify:CR=1|jgi:hypothetical protein|tara:strand:+ start:183 stop:524 length:342 start_codon:yes stop_codon:yes gene_type:complete